MRWQEKMWFLGFNQQQVTSETELAKIGVEATKMGGKQRISILMVGIYSHFYSFYVGTMSRYRIHPHCHMHYTMGSFWVSDTTTFGSHETYFELYVFSAMAKKWIWTVIWIAIVMGLYDCNWLQWIYHHRYEYYPNLWSFLRKMMMNSWGKRGCQSLKDIAYCCNRM